MTAISTTAQLSAFTMVRNALQTNSVLNTKFDTADYYEFEPNHKSSDFRGFPYIIIRTPDTETDLLVLKHTTTLKNFNIPIILRLEYTARSKFKDYANAIIAELESSESYFELFGYYDTKIELVSTDDQQVIQEKQIVEGEFLLTFQGNVER